MTMRDRGDQWDEIERVMGYCKKALRAAYVSAGGKNIKKNKGGQRKNFGGSLSLHHHALYLKHGGINFVRKVLDMVERGELTP